MYPIKHMRPLAAFTSPSHQRSWSPRWVSLRQHRATLHLSHPHLTLCWTVCMLCISIICVHACMWHARARAHTRACARARTHTHTHTHTHCEYHVMPCLQSECGIIMSLSVRVYRFRSSLCWRKIFPCQAVSLVSSCTLSSTTEYHNIRC